MVSVGIGSLQLAAEPAKTNFAYFPQERKRGVCGVFPWPKGGLAGRLYAPFVPEPTNAAFVAFFLDFLAFLASLALSGYLLSINPSPDGNTPPDKGGSVRDCARSGALARGKINYDGAVAGPDPSVWATTAPGIMPLTCRWGRIITANEKTRFKISKSGSAAKRV